jgi:hypothetical protein
MVVDTLAPGGTALIANFLPTNFAKNHIEAFADWWLIYRTKQEITRLVTDGAPGRASGQQASPICIKTSRTSKSIAYDSTVAPLANRLDTLAPDPSSSHDMMGADYSTATGLDFDRISRHPRRIAEDGGSRNRIAPSIPNQLQLLFTQNILRDLRPLFLLQIDSLLPIHKWHLLDNSLVSAPLWPISVSDSVS